MVMVVATISSFAGDVINGDMNIAMPLMPTPKAKTMAMPMMPPPPNDRDVDTAQKIDTALLQDTLYRKKHTR